MKKFCSLFLLILILAGTATADPIKTVQQLWNAVFVETDLKLAFSMLSAADQEFIKTQEPELYSEMIGEGEQEADQLDFLDKGIKRVILSTLGRVLKLETRLGESSQLGQEVLVSVLLPVDMDFLLKVVNWVKVKEAEYKEAGEKLNELSEIGNLLKEFDTLINNLNYKESIALNSYVIVVKEDGQEKIFFDLQSDNQKLKRLKGL